MPDVSSNASAATTRTFVALDVHKNSIVAAILPAEGGTPVAPVARKRLAQVRDVDVRGLGGGRRRRLSPQLLDQPVA